MCVAAAAAGPVVPVITEEAARGVDEAPIVSRRAAASIIHARGTSAGPAGVLPADVRSRAEKAFEIAVATRVTGSRGATAGWLCTAGTRTDDAVVTGAVAAGGAAAVALDRVRPLAVLASMWTAVAGDADSAVALIEVADSEDVDLRVSVGRREVSFTEAPGGLGAFGPAARDPVALPGRPPEVAAEPAAVWPLAEPPVSAHATAVPEVKAAPIPNATARPPIRPIVADALMSFCIRPADRAAEPIPQRSAVSWS